MTLFLLGTVSSLAYVGPGLGLGVIGVILGVLLSIFLAFVGILWYPLKRFIRVLRGGAKTSAVTSSEDAPISDDNEPAV